MQQRERGAENICVYCASSQRCHAVYHDAARRMGEVLATRGFTVVYGGEQAREFASIR